MLRVISPTTNCGCACFKTKCAEIHYQTCDFSILCIFCGLATENYSDFTDHFRSEHFKDFVKTKEVYVEPVVTKACDIKLEMVKYIKHPDPLEVVDKGSIDADVVMQVLEEKPEFKTLKTEPQEEILNSVGKRIFPNETIKKDSRKIDRGNKSPIYNLKIESFNLNAAQRNKPCKKKYSKLKQSTQQMLQHGQGTDVSHTSMATESQDEEGKVKGVSWTQDFQSGLKCQKRAYKPRNKPNICSYCGRTFRRRHQLDTHLNIHTGLKPHQCEICGRQFRAVTTLTRHLSTHEQRKAFNCKYCIKIFTHRAALISHESRHTQERNVPCDECAKFFYTENQMDTHKRKVHNKNDTEALPFACDLCLKRYRSASMLSTHKFKKHFKTAKFSCEQCDKKFINEDLLQVHKKIHIDALITNETAQ